MKTIKVNLKNNSYSILIGRNLLSSIGRLLKPLHVGSKVFIVSNKKIPRVFLNTVKKSLNRSGFKTNTYLLPYGDERDKSVEVLRKLWNQMARIPLDRSSTVLALGGGVVGDVTGFAAATYMRGISLIQIPTTLLAQVDSAIGGKTAVDLPTAKNIIGAFYQPKLVVSDINTLKTLGVSQFKNSLAEVIKYGIIGDEKLFLLLEEKMSGFLSAIRYNRFGSSEISFLETIIARSAAAKAEVVSEDEREIKGKRMILNYGHTFAHALEAASKFKLPHGQAVAIGMIFAGELACRLGIFSRSAQERQIQLIAKLELALKCRYLGSDLISFMKRDKKVRNDKFRFVLPRRIGQVGIEDRVPETILRQILDDDRRK